MKKFAALSGIVLIAGLALTGCESATGGSDVASDCEPRFEFETINDGQLTISIPDLVPFSAYNNGNPEGVDVEVAKNLAEANCLTVNWQQANYAGAVPSVSNGRADLTLGCFYRTEERAQVAALTAPIYTDSMASISKDGVDSIPDMESMKVGTVDGYLWVQDMKDVMGDNLTIYPSSVEMEADLEAGRIDVGLDSFGAAQARHQDDDYTIAEVQKDERVAASIEPAQIGFPMTKDNSAMLEAFDTLINEMHEDGTIAQILADNGLPESAADTGEPRLIG
ncbi:amino acid ABC transporter substrate-binding protein [Brevibacterium daeguense]|uniref:Amino acid ABC transporter substrate-binding protein n=1 Tax=Brevibacterium daeguense TaxID=909936 RepID=A0ABP8EIC4_9MICO|nr:transporter substrate-binding domain-containing protein [Brevibacterium daeguense]